MTQRQTRPTGTKTTDETATRPAARHGVDLANDILDEIDAVLEDNPLEVVKAFVQKGGQ